MYSRNHMKMQKFAIFLKIKLKINMLNITIMAKLGTNFIMQGNRMVLHIEYVI